jgi:hypothetical protein
LNAPLREPGPIRSGWPLAANRRDPIDGPIERRARIDGIQRGQIGIIVPAESYRWSTTTKPPPERYRPTLPRERPGGEGDGRGSDGAGPSPSRSVARPEGRDEESGEPCADDAPPEHRFVPLDGAARKAARWTP